MPAKGKWQSVPRAVRSDNKPKEKKKQKPKESKQR
jgi:hypothetical protein